MRFNEVLRSYIDMFQVDRGKARVRGWVFHPRLPIESLSISLDGIPWVEGVEPIDVPEVQAAFPDYPCALKVGFDVSAALKNAARLDPLRTTIAITPTSSGRPLDTVRTGYFQPAVERRSRPQPPEHLQERVGGTGEFVEIGFQLMTLVRTYMEKHKPFSEAQRILDWGCGCGRVLAQLQKFVPAAKLRHLGDDALRRGDTVRLAERAGSHHAAGRGADAERHRREVEGHQHARQPCCHLRGERVRGDGAELLRSTERLLP